MKTLLLLTGIIALVSTTGCIVADGGHREHARVEHRDDVIMAPAVVVHTPEVVVRPPEIIVH
jgi:hypothetical protein